MLKRFRTKRERQALGAILGWVMVVILLNAVALFQLMEGGGSWGFIIANSIGIGIPGAVLAAISFTKWVNDGE